MEDIYGAILRFDYPSGLIPIKKKQDMVRGLIEKTRGELAVASCERRIEYKTDEFRGILDEMSINKNKIVFFIYSPLLIISSTSFFWWMYNYRLSI